MKGFVLFLVVVLLAYTYAAPHNYGSVTGGSESFVAGELSNSHIGSGSLPKPGNSLPKPGNSLPKGNGAFSPGDAQRANSRRTRNWLYPTIPSTNNVGYISGYSGYTPYSLQYKWRVNLFCTRSSMTEYLASCGAHMTPPYSK
ncbi:hypothetical protein B5X24_HaOG209427 [Helicoverpa armigera]|uniref:Uncharacterized protein n=1 Tax=Helicoverpa armigera TaxID=29058 RepID=A0A2W1BEF5_HELAM|nr:hypothetical protein B5X24_HaOG209427 [Helicoverpa armigera]